MQVFSRFDMVLGTGQVTTGAAALVTSLTNAPAVSQFMQGIWVTNNDATNAIYLGPQSNVSSTNYTKKLSPGEFFEWPMGRAVYNGLYCVAAAGTPAMSVSVLQ